MKKRICSARAHFSAFLCSPFAVCPKQARPLYPMWGKVNYTQEWRNCFQAWMHPLCPESIWPSDVWMSIHPLCTRSFSWVLLQLDWSLADSSESEQYSFNYRRWSLNALQTLFGSTIPTWFSPRIRANFWCAPHPAAPPPTTKTRKWLPEKNHIWKNMKNLKKIDLLIKIVDRRMAVISTICQWPLCAGLKIDNFTNTFRHIFSLQKKPTLSETWKMKGNR